MNEEPLSHLKAAIEKAQLEDWAENGRCSMCSSGHLPSEDGYHHHRLGKFVCGNNESCVLCRGCLPPGEICGGCSRKNMFDYEC